MGVVTGGGGGAAFNGGTIHNPITIANAPNATLLELDAAAGANSDVLLIHADASDTSNTVFQVDQHGNLTIKSGGAFQEASITLSDNTSGNAGSISLDTFSGVALSPEGSANGILKLAPVTGHSGRQLRSGAPGTGTEVLAISSGGYLLIKTHAAPADGDIAAGECALWFDQTNGTAALNIKAKQADGTVKTATIPVIT